MSTPTRYDNKTAQEILQQAAALESQGREAITRQELVTMGLEMGLSEAAISEAEQTYIERQNRPTAVPLTETAVTTETPVPDIAAEERQFRRELKLGVGIHAAIITFINIFLILLNLMVSPDFFWFIFPLLGTGFGLALHGFITWLIRGPLYDIAFERWFAKREARRLRRQARSAPRRYPPLSDSRG